MRLIQVPGWSVSISLNSVVVEKDLFHISYPFLILFRVPVILTPYLLYYKFGFGNRISLFGIMESNNGLERSNMQDKIVIHGARAHNLKILMWKFHGTS